MTATIPPTYDTRTDPPSPSLGELVNAGRLEHYRRRALHQCGELHPDGTSYCLSTAHGVDAHHRGPHRDGNRYWPQVIDGGDIERGGEPEKRADDGAWPSIAGESYAAYLGTPVDVDASGTVAVIR